MVLKIDFLSRIFEKLMDNDNKNNSSKKNAKRILETIINMIAPSFSIIFLFKRELFIQLDFPKLITLSIIINVVFFMSLEGFSFIKNFIISILNRNITNKELMILIYDIEKYIKEIKKDNSNSLIENNLLELKEISLKTKNSNYFFSENSLKELKEKKEQLANNLYEYKLNNQIDYSEFTKVSNLIIQFDILVENKYENNKNNSYITLNDKMIDITNTTMLLFTGFIWFYYFKKKSLIILILQFFKITLFFHFIDILYLIIKLIKKQIKITSYKINTLIKKLYI